MAQENNILTRGNDFYLRVSVYKKLTEQEERQPFDIDACEQWTGTVINTFGRTLNVPCRLESSNTVIFDCVGLKKGDYVIELTGLLNGRNWRVAERGAIGICEYNSQAKVTYDAYEAEEGQGLDMTLQLVPTAEVIGQNAYEIWKELPGNEDKTLQNYIDEVLDLNGLTAQINAAIIIATHPDYVGSDNYVYHWAGTAYTKTNIYVKGDTGDKGDKGDKGDTGEKGDKGDTGAQGSKGDKGDKGDTGAQGEQGERGEQGVQGIQGERGRDYSTQVEYIAQGTQALTIAADKYYNIQGEVGTLAITLPAIEETGEMFVATLHFTTGVTPNVTLTSADSKTISTLSGYTILPNNEYEVSILYNGVKWFVLAGAFDTA